MNHYAIITKLIGPVKPVGETHADFIRLQNLHAMIDLVGKLVDAIDVVAENAWRSLRWYWHGRRQVIRWTMPSLSCR